MRPSILETLESRSLFNGLAQEIVQGRGTLRAKADGLQSAETTFDVIAPVWPAVMVARPPPKTKKKNPS